MSDFDVLPVPAQAQQELDAALVRSRDIFNRDGRFLDPESTQAAIYRVIGDWHAGTLAQSARSTQDLAIDLGAAWGDAVCRGLGWEWAWLKAPDFEELAVVASDRSVATFPILYLYKVLLDSDRQTTLLLYNMLKAGMAEAQAGELRLVE